MSDHLGEMVAAQASHEAQSQLLRGKVYRAEKDRDSLLLLMLDAFEGDSIRSEDAICEIRDILEERREHIRKLITNEPT